MLNPEVCVFGFLRCTKKPQEKIVTLRNRYQTPGRCVSPSPSQTGGGHHTFRALKQPRPKSLEEFQASIRQSISGIPPPPWFTATIGPRWWRFQVYFWVFSSRNTWGKWWSNLTWAYFLKWVVKKPPTRWWITVDLFLGGMKKTSGFDGWCFMLLNGGRISGVRKPCWYGESRPIILQGFTYLGWLAGSLNHHSVSPLCYSGVKWTPKLPAILRDLFWDGLLFRKTDFNGFCLWWPPMIGDQKVSGLNHLVKIFLVHEEFKGFTIK